MNKVRIFKNVYEICSFKTKRPFEIFILLICSKFCVKAQKPILEYLMNEAAKKIKNWFELLLFRSKFHWCIFIESSKNYQNTILFELLNEIEMSWIWKWWKLFDFLIIIWADVFMSFSWILGVLSEYRLDVPRNSTWNSIFRFQNILFFNQFTKWVGEIRRFLRIPLFCTDNNK